MNVPTDALQGASGVSFSVVKQENGTYVAKCDSMPQLPAQQGRDAAEAIEFSKRLVERYVSNGFRQ